LYENATKYTADKSEPLRSKNTSIPKDADDEFTVHKLTT